MRTPLNSGALTSLPGGRHPCLPLGGLSALAGLSRFPYGAPSPPNTCGESPKTRARIGAILGALNTLGEGSLGRAQQVNALRHLRLAASPKTRSAHLHRAHDQNDLVQQIRLSCGPGHLLAPHCEKKARHGWLWDRASQGRGNMNIASSLRRYYLILGDFRALLTLFLARRPPAGAMEMAGGGRPP